MIFISATEKFQRQAQPGCFQMPFEAGDTPEISSKLQKVMNKLDRESPRFDEMPPNELLIIAASNSFHNGKALKELRTMITIIGIVTLGIAARLLGWI